MKVSVVIVNFNTRELLEAALESLPPDVERVVVDNGSGDGSVEMVRSKFPHTKLVVNAENRGYSAAVNQGVRAATGDAFLLLNSDARLEPGAVEALTAAAAARPRAAAVGGRLHGPDGRLQANTYPPLSFGNELLKTLRAYRWLPRSVSAELFYGDWWHHDAPRSVGRISGTCLLIPRRAWEKVGELSEEFFVYGEVHDWCERARAKGLEVWFEPKAKARHGVAATASRIWTEDERVARIWDAHYRLLRRHKGRWMTWLFAANYLVSNALAWLKVALLGTRPAFRDRLATEVWAHLSALAPSVLGRSGGEMGQLLVQSTQRLAAILAMKLLSLFTTVAMARSLGRGRLGVAILVIGLADLASLLASQSLPTVVAKHIADPKEKPIHGAILGCSLIALFASALLFSAPFFLFPNALATIYGEPEMGDHLRLGGWLMATGLGSSFLMAWFQGFGEIARFSKLQFAQSALTAAGVAAWLLFGNVGGLDSVHNLLTALCAANSASFVLWAWSARRLVHRHGVRVTLGGEEVWGKVFGFSVPATLSSAASWPQFWAVSTELKLRATFGAVGLFSVGFQLPKNIIVFSQALGAPYVPLVSRLRGEGREGDIVARVQRALAAVVFLPSFAFALLSVPALRLLYGVEFVAAWDAVIVLSAAWYLKSLNDAVSHYLVGAGRLWRALAFNLLQLGALVGLAWWLSAEWAAFGAALAFAGAYALYLLASVVTLRHELHLRRRVVAELAGVPMLFFGSCFWISPRLDTAAGWLAAAAASALAVAWVVRILTEGAKEHRP